MPIGCESPFASCHRVRVKLLSCHLNAEQAFVQSNLSENTCMRLPKGCGSMSGKVVKSCHRLYCLMQSSGQCHRYWGRGMRRLGFELFGADACVVRLLEAVAVSTL